MSNVLDLNARLAKANAPDSNQTYVDGDGVTWLKFGVEYKDQRGRTMTFDIWATSSEDAGERLQLIKENGKVYGQILHESEWKQ